MIHKELHKMFTSMCKINQKICDNKTQDSTYTLLRKFWRKTFIKNHCLEDMCHISKPDSFWHMCSSNVNSSIGTL